MSDCHYGADELAVPTRARAQTPSTPWNPQPAGRQSANREQLGARALRDLGILQLVHAGCEGLGGPESEEVREAYRLLTAVEPPRAALLSARVSRAKPSLINNPGAAHLLLLIEVGALYAAEDLKGAAAVLLEALSPGGGYAGSPEIQRVYERVVGKLRFHRQFFDRQAPRLPDVEVRPPTPEPEPEPEVFLGEEWEGRLQRLRDLWSVEPNPRDALIALRSELRDRIALLAKVYVAYCAVDGHGTKIPMGKTFDTKDRRLVGLQQGAGGDGPADTELTPDLFIVRIPSLKQESGGQAQDTAALEQDEGTDSRNATELHVSMLIVQGLQGHLAEDEEALTAIFSRFGMVLLAAIRQRPHAANWALVSYLRQRDADRAVRDGVDEMVKDLQANGCHEPDQSFLSVTWFDARRAITSSGGMAVFATTYREQLKTVVQELDGGVERLLELQHSTSSSCSSSSSSDSEPDLDDGGGVGLTMQMCAYEQVYVDQGFQRMFQFQWWRLMKACRLPSSELRNHEINELFHQCQHEPPISSGYLSHLVAVGASEAVAKKQGMAQEKIWEEDLHHPHQSVNLYDFVELLVRIAHGRYTEMASIALRFRIMMERDLGPQWPGGLDSNAKQAIETHHQSIYDQFYANAQAQGQLSTAAAATADADMVAHAGGSTATARVQPKGKKQTDDSAKPDKIHQLLWRSDVQEWITDRSVRMWKVFHFMAGTSRDSLRALLSFNSLLKNLIWCEMLSPELTVKRTARAIAMTTFDPDVAPQNHPSNDEVLLTYDEFEEAVVRFAGIRAKGTLMDDSFIGQALAPFVDDLFTQIAFKMPGRF